MVLVNNNNNPDTVMKLWQFPSPKGWQLCQRIYVSEPVYFHFQGAELSVLVLPLIGSAQMLPVVPLLFEAQTRLRSETLSPCSLSLAVSPDCSDGARHACTQGFFCQASCDEEQEEPWLCVQAGDSQSGEMTDLSKGWRSHKNSTHHFLAKFWMVITERNHSGNFACLKEFCCY